MPAQQAMFDPIPPDLDLAALVAKTPNFDWVERIKLEDVKRMGRIEFEKLVAIQVIHGGRPLIVEGWNAELPPWLYSAEWLKTNMGKKVEAVRDITNEINHEMTIGHYLDNIAKLTNAMTPAKYRDPRRQRLYLKDIDCPTQWREQLSGIFPKFLFYMNENNAEKGEPGSTTFKNGVGQELQTQGIAPAGDLMSNLPPDMRAENLQLYIGHEGTYTPAHKEMCGTSSQNIMVETSSTVKDGEKDGSSIWFMTESQDREVVGEYFLSMLGHDIEIEKHFAQIVAWKKAPFPVFVVEQKVGDLVLVPPLAPHQVWNRGNRTIKVAWNRTTVETLEFALAESLPRAKMVCRDEQYRVKATVYYSLVKYYSRLRDADRQDEIHEFSNEVHEKVWDSFRVQMLKEDFTRLAKLFADIMVEEMFSPNLPNVKDVEYLPFEGSVTCSYCRCNIFNRFLTCKSCCEELVNGDDDTYDVCMDCYAMGRSCACISNLSWVEQWRWSELTKKYAEYHDLVRFITPDPERWILPLTEERQKRGKKTTAEVCQEQLLRRPWQDIKNPDPEILSDIETDPEDEDFKKMMAGKRRRPKAPETLSKKPCHICKKPDKPWKLAECTTCDAAYCYGSLWRAFDIKPEEIMKDLNWQCPDCLDICSCASCQRKHPHRAIYEPKGTRLGHDTKAVADPRSVESLVDFSRSNLTWLRDNDTNPKKTKRMQKLIEEAKARKIEYYRYAAEQWGIDPATHGLGILAGYQTYDENKAASSAHAHARSFAVEESQAAHDNNLDIMDHRQTMPPSFDNVAPVAPMGSMAGPPPPAYTNAGHPASINPYQTQNEGSPSQHINDNSQFVSPSELMNEPRATYPDALTSDMLEEHSRPQPHNDEVDDGGILFQDPDAPSLATDFPQSPYPRLLHDTEEDALRLTAGQKKRKRQSILVDGDMNEAHKEFILTEQRKKLVAARKEGRYYITQGQLLGCHPFMVTLKVPNKKAELGAMAEIDAGRAAVRHNPREARTNIARRVSLGNIDLDAMDLDDEEEDGDIVISDVRPRKDGESEPERQARPFPSATSPEAGNKKRRGRPRKRLPSLEPGAVPYEAAKKGKPGRPRKSRGNADEDDDDDPFEDRYPSPKRKSRVAARTPASSGRPRGRPRKLQEEKVVETLKISDDEVDSDGEIIPKQRSSRRVSMPIPSFEASPRKERSRKNRKSAAAVMEGVEPPDATRLKRSRGVGEPEFDHTMLPRNTKRSRRSDTSMSQPIVGGGIDGGIDGAGSGAENYADNYMSQDEHTDDDIEAPPLKMRGVRDRSSPMGVDGDDNMDVLTEGEPMTIPMADDDAEFERPAFSPRRDQDSASDSDDTLAAPSPSKQLSLEIDRQSERQHTVESMHSKAESLEGGYRMADTMPSSSPEAHHTDLSTFPVRPPSGGYRMGSYSGDDTASEEVPTASPSHGEDDDLNAKFAVLRELEEEQERERQEKAAAERAKVAAEEKRKTDAKNAKVEARRQANEELEKEIREAAEANAAQERAQTNRLAMLKADEETAEEARIAKERREEETKAMAAARAMQDSVSVASDDSALEDNSDIEAVAPSSNTKATSKITKDPKMMSLAERRALAGKSGIFKVAASKTTLVQKRLSTPSIVLPGLTPQQRKRYSTSHIYAEGSEEEEDSDDEIPAVAAKNVRLQRNRAGSAISGTRSARKASGRRR